MEGRTFSKVISDLAPVDLGDVSHFIEEWDDQRAMEVLMPTLAQDAKFLQPAADFNSGLPAL